MASKLGQAPFRVNKLENIKMAISQAFGLHLKSEGTFFSLASPCFNALLNTPIMFTLILTIMLTLILTLILVTILTLILTIILTLIHNIILYIILTLILKIIILTLISSYFCRILNKDFKESL